MAEVVQSFYAKIEFGGLVNGDDGAQMKPIFVRRIDFSDGSGANQILKVWQDKVRPLNTTSEDLDLGAGGVADFQGADLNLSALKVLVLQELSGAGGLALKPGGTNPITTLLSGTNPALNIGPNGLIVIINPTADGWGVTNGSADRLAVEALANSNYQILLAGE